MLGTQEKFENFAENRGRYRCRHCARIAGHYAFGQKPLQAKEEPRDQSVHHPDLDNRADLIGVEQDFMRGATIFNDPGYRDLPNAAQMQFSPAP